MTEALVDYSGVKPWPRTMKVYMGRRWPIIRDDESGHGATYVGDSGLGDVSIMVAHFGPPVTKGWDPMGLGPLTHLVHHSPTGMEWGYAGSGPADLALSILANHFGEWPTKGELKRGKMTVRCDCDEGRGDRGFDEGCERCFGSGEATEPLKCWTYHHPFKDAFCGRWGRSWAITSDDIDHWLAGLKGPGGRPAHTFQRAPGADVDPDHEAAQDAARSAAQPVEEVEF